MYNIFYTKEFVSYISSYAGFERKIVNHGLILISKLEVPTDV